MSYTPKVGDSAVFNWGNGQKENVLIRKIREDGWIEFQPEGTKIVHIGNPNNFVGKADKSVERVWDTIGTTPTKAGNYSYEYKDYDVTINIRQTKDNGILVADKNVWNKEYSVIIRDKEGKTLENKYIYRKDAEYKAFMKEMRKKYKL